MKINSITSYKSSINSRQTPNNNHRRVSFGFGEDYGYNPIVDPNFDDSNHSGPKISKLQALKNIASAIGLPIIMTSEALGKDKQKLENIERLGWLAEELEKKEMEAQENSDDD